LFSTSSEKDKYAENYTEFNFTFTPERKGTPAPRNVMLFETCAASKQME